MRSRFSIPTILRLACLALLLLALIDPKVRRLGRGLDLAVLVDRSASAEEALGARLPEIVALLERSRSADDRLTYVDYAELAQVPGEADELPASRRQQTRTALALQFALSRLSGERPGRLLLLTDGYSTEPLTGLAERFQRQGVALDFRLVAPPQADDYRVERLEIPARVQLSEAFVIDVKIAGQPDAMVHLEVLRDGARLGGSEVQLRGGTASVRFSDRLPQAGAHRYTARVIGPNDARRGNDALERWIEVAGGPRVLLITAYANDPLVPVLAAQGFQVEVGEPGLVHPGQLTGAKLVILNNVAAHRLASDFLGALDFYVRAQGGGLLMAGGKQAFGAGGYFGSPIADLLPVSMELRQEHRKLAVALAIVLDRSGSMSARIAGGRQKMELADEGAARSIELLGPSDAVAVYAVDTEPHEIVPLTTLGANRAALIDSVRRIASSGGGICVPTGLRAAHEQLKKASAGQRHVVLFADANDATQEAPDPAAIAAMVGEGITVSVIGLGTDSDSGAAYLQEVAEQGRGRIFFNANADELPALFAQETVAVARSAFIPEPVKVIPAPGWIEIAAAPLPWLETVDGYNLSYLRPEASAGALSGDEYRSPLVAWWQRGAGRAAAVSFPLGGEHSAGVRAWAQYGDFIQTLARWLAGEALPPGLGLQTRLDGTELRLDLYHDSTWNERFSAAAPRILLGTGATGRTRPLTWERLEPGHYAATAQLPPEELVRGAVQAGPHTLPFGPLVAGSSVEWNPDPARIQELRALSKATGGEERLELSGVWQAPRYQEYRSLRPYLLVTLLGVFLAEALLTRMGVTKINWGAQGGGGQPAG
jgi:hypothetical protein